MKRLMIVVVLILGIGVAAAPLVTGLVMETAVRRTCEEFNEVHEATGSGVSIELVRYDRGYLASEIEWKVLLGDLRTVYGVEEIVFVDRARHGLTSVASETLLEANEWYSDFVHQKLAGKDPLRISTRFGLTGDFASTISLDGFSFPVEGDMVSAKPGEVRLVLAKDLKGISAKGAWQGVSVPGKALLDGFSMKGDFDKITTFIWEGSFSFDLEKIEITEGPDPLEVADFSSSYALTYHEETNTLDLDFTYGLASVAGKRGPILDDATLRCGVHRMDARGYEDFMRIYMSTIQSALEEAASAPRNDGRAREAVADRVNAMRVELIAAYEKLLKKGLEIRIEEFTARLPQGSVTGNLALGLKEDIALSKVVQVAMKPSLAPKLFSLESDVRLPAGLVPDASRLTMPLFDGMETGLFLESDGRLVHRAEIRDGMLMLNGRPVLL
ncbi:MAG: DUF945 family protein [Desulfobacterales bacterium]